MKRLYSVRRPKALFWKCGLSREGIERQLRTGTISDNWEVCNHGDTSRIVAIGNIDSLLTPEIENDAVRAYEDSTGININPTQDEGISNKTIVKLWLLAILVSAIGGFIVGFQGHQNNLTIIILVAGWLLSFISTIWAMVRLWKTENTRIQTVTHHSTDNKDDEEETGTERKLQVELSPETRLVKLNELKNKGLISESSYESQSREIIKKI